MTSQRQNAGPGRLVGRLGVLVLVLSAGLLAAWPYLEYPGLPAGTDAELHVFRIAELGYSLQAGNPYPRWAPDFFHGYGYPIFNYYAPLTYHLGHWVSLGHPQKAVEAARFCFIFAHIVGAAGAYCLGHVFGRQGGGLLSALTFSLSPYVHIVNPHIRGDLPESLALAFLPWALWAWERLWQDGKARYVLASVLATSAVFLSHNLTGLTVVALVGALSVWRWVISRRAQHTGHAVVTGFLFVLLTAFFWLPFLAERGHVRLDVAGDGHYDFRNHFLLLQELLAPSELIDWRSATMNVPMSAGPVTVLLALCGTVWCLARRGFRTLGLYIASAALAGWLTLRGSLPLWELIAPMAYFQFPWRFLGPLAALLIPPVASLGSIGLDGAGASHAGGIEPGRVQTLLRSCVVPLAFVLVLLAALPHFYVTPWESELESVTPLTMIETELRGRWRGTTSTNDFVPTTVDMIPGPTVSVIESYRQQETVDRVNRYTLPDGASVTTVASDPWITHLTVTTPKPFLLRLYLFYFPGWRAYVDGIETPIEIADPEGFVTLQVPEGSHEVEVRFGTTPARSWGWVLSALGLAMLIGVLVTLHNQQEETQEDRSAEIHGTDGVRRRPISRVSISIGAIMLAFVLLKVTLLNPLGWFRIISPIGEALIAGYSQKANLAGEALLLGYDLSSTRAASGDVVEVTVYWMAQRPMTRTYQSFVHLVYPEGEIWSQSDHLNPGGFPTNLWPTDRYISDEHRLIIPDGVRPGPYLLVTGLYTLEDNRRLPIISAECGGRADSVILCQPVLVR